MSLVLAIQPDDSQGARLVSVCRRIGTELVLARTAADALAALGERVPDVVLSAPLLPANDEHAVAERLKALGDAALHVQAISMPVLGDPPVEEPPPPGLLKTLRRRRRPTGPAVCDAVTFAGELSGHLLRAVAERAAITSDPIEAEVPEVAPVIERLLEDLWPHERVSTADVGEGASPEVRLKPDTTVEGVVSGFSRTDAVPDPRFPDPGSRIPDPDPHPPLDIELISLVDAIAEQCRAKKRKGRTGRPRRKRRVYDDAAYFDPARSEFAAVVEKLDEFTGVRASGAAPAWRGQAGTRASRC